MLYFAYGSNLLESRIRQLDRAPGAVRIDRASLRGYDLRFHKRGADGSGKCDCFESGDGSHVVHGALFAVPEEQHADLDRVEGLGHGYSKRELEVEVGYRSQSGTTKAWLYCAQSTHIDDTLEPFRWYRDLVVAGARSSGFPDEYIRAIAAVEVQEDPDHARAQRMQRLLPSGPSGAPSSGGESAQPTTEPAPVCGRLGGEHLAAGIISRK